MLQPAAMSDRLNELRRQHALMREHLQWLEKEIAAEDQSGAEKCTTPASFSTKGGETELTAKADELLGQYAAESQAAPAMARRGCWILFCAALATLTLAVVLWYWLRR